jgi:hypothetical protein
MSLLSEFSARLNPWKLCYVQIYFDDIYCKFIVLTYKHSLVSLGGGVS